jgi:hypothetical protein
MSRASFHIFVIPDRQKVDSDTVYTLIHRSNGMQFTRRELTKHSHLANSRSNGNHGCRLSTLLSDITVLGTRTYICTLSSLPRFMWPALATM